MTTGRICLCNSLCASAGIGQFRQGQDEPQLITIGDDLDAVRESLLAGRDNYTAADVIEPERLRAFQDDRWRLGQRLFGFSESSLRKRYFAKAMSQITAAMAHVQAA